MSKIEDALNKAKKHRLENPASQVAVKESPNVSVLHRGLVPSGDTNAPVINHVSSAKEIALMDEDVSLDQNQLSELKIIFSDMPNNRLANIYRDLRTKLLQQSKCENFIVMITSCMPNNDCGAETLNLATAFSFDESKTSLLIDCNLNNPQLDSKLKLQSDVGLTDYLEDESISIESIIHKTGIKRLRMLPAGSSRETATEYFTSLRMHELISNLLSRYSDRYIFINSAPITESADTRILVDMCDYVILVVPYGQATKNRVKQAADAIGEKKLFGVVFNDVPNNPLLKNTNKQKNKQ
ncbi:MAG: hypothetical protein OQK72_11510 [Gammaproteobacteria bacterium]|nr:hypothetical protein [Gammaproteobacteria bacterium]MCW9005916.1 hypothetical protein [Gammaproteobacteria bacterium]MCW9055064.1 hypothetical protein [Gammaproteobacteria bacterium]